MSTAPESRIEIVFHVKRSGDLFGQHTPRTMFHVEHTAENLKLASERG